MNDNVKTKKIKKPKNDELWKKFDEEFIQAPGVPK